MKTTWIPLQSLPLAVSLVSRWVRAREREALTRGQPLSPSQLEDARSAGVARPEHVRLLRVKNIPLFSNPLLKPAAFVGGAFFAGTAGLTVRYGILVRSDWWGDRRLLVHELAHVAQYERLGGIRPFLRVYLQECITAGYPLGALEQEAIGVAAEICRTGS